MKKVFLALICSAGTLLYADTDLREKDFSKPASGTSEIVSAGWVTDAIKLPPTMAMRFPFNVASRGGCFTFFILPAPTGESTYPSFSPELPGSVQLPFSAHFSEAKTLNTSVTAQRTKQIFSIGLSFLLS